VERGGSSSFAVRRKKKKNQRLCEWVRVLQSSCVCVSLCDRISQKPRVHISMANNSDPFNGALSMTPIVRP